MKNSVIYYSYLRKEMHMKDNRKHLIKDINRITVVDVPDLKQCLLERLDFEYGREPDSEGQRYDDWSDRVYELEEMTDLLEDENNLSEVIEMIKDFQLIYGGLSRLQL